jgi:hypothetical protein
MWNTNLVEYSHYATHAIWWHPGIHYPKQVKSLTCDLRTVKSLQCLLTSFRFCWELNTRRLWSPKLILISVISCHNSPRLDSWKDQWKQKEAERSRSLHNQSVLKRLTKVAFFRDVASHIICKGSSILSMIKWPPSHCQLRNRNAGLWTLRGISRQIMQKRALSIMSGEKTLVSTAKIVNPICDYCQMPSNAQKKWGLSTLRDFRTIHHTLPVPEENALLHETSEIIRCHSKSSELFH